MCIRDRVVGDQSATVTVYAKRQTLQDINADDIVATADIREMDTDTGLVPIKVTIPEYAGDYESADASPRNLQIRVEKTGKMCIRDSFWRLMLIRRKKEV